MPYRHTHAITLLLRAGALQRHTLLVGYSSINCCCCVCVDASVKCGNAVWKEWERASIDTHNNIILYSSTRATNS